MSDIIVCGPGPVEPDDSDCPDNDRHTPHPKDYLGFHDWADDMRAQGKKPYRCRKCRLWKVWR